MTDSVAVLDALGRVEDSFGAPIPGATLHFFEAGTDTPRNVYGDPDLATVPLGAIVYTDGAGYAVTAEGSSTKTGIFTGIGNYDIEIWDADDVPIITHTNWPGALDTSGFAGGETVEQSVLGLSKSSNYTILAADNGYLIEFDSSGGDCVATLPSAIDVGNGFYVGVRHNGTGNEVVVSGAQAIRHMGAGSLRMALLALGETIWLHSNGANWVVYAYVPRLNSTVGVITITDRLSAPPSHVVGARYQLTASPSGAWASFAENDIVDDDGTNWTKKTPPADCGWITYVQDEDQSYQFRGSAWVPFTASDTNPGLIEIATAAEVITGTDVARAVTPGRQHNHQSAVKAWGKANTTGSLLSSYNITSVSDDGAGQLTVTIANDFATVNYSITCTTLGATAAGIRVVTQAAGSFELRNSAYSDGSNIDPSGWMFSASGVQA